MFIFHSLRLLRLKFCQSRRAERGLVTLNQRQVTKSDEILTATRRAEPFFRPAALKAEPVE